MKLDLSATDAGFDPLPNGRYHVKITDYEYREAGPEAKNPGSPYINWELTVQAEPYDGRRLWLNTSLLPQALFGIKGLLIATGLYTEEQLNSDEFDLDPDEVLGADVKAVVVKTTYQGEPTNNVKRIRPLSEEDEDASASLLPG